MSGDARISGRISITPPITKNELAGNRWAFRNVESLYPDVRVHLDFGDDEDLAFVSPSAEVGTAIVPTGYETSARTLLDDVQRIVGQFRRTSNGAERTFGGWLHVIWGGGESVYRVHVVDGLAVQSEPSLWWPDGARDEDGAQ